MEKFLDWLKSEMETKGKKQTDIANTKIVTDGAVSLLFSGKTKTLTYDMCRAISRALEIPLITVYRKASLLEPLPEDDLWTEGMEARLRKIPDYLRESVEHYIDSINRAHKKK